MENNNNKKQITTWFTKSNYVDIDTGEILDKRLVDTKQYTVINKKKHHEIKETVGLVEITNECRKSGQLKLFS